MDEKKFKRFITNYLQLIEIRNKASDLGIVFNVIDDLAETCIFAVFRATLKEETEQDAISLFFDFTRGDFYTKDPDMFMEEFYKKDYFIIDKNNL